MMREKEKKRISYVEGRERGHEEGIMMGENKKQWKKH